MAKGIHARVSGDQKQGLGSAVTGSQVSNAVVHLQGSLVQNPGNKAADKGTGLKSDKVMYSGYYFRSETIKGLVKVLKFTSKQQALARCYVGRQSVLYVCKVLDAN